MNTARENESIRVNIRSNLLRIKYFFIIWIIIFNLLNSLFIKLITFIYLYIVIYSINIFLNSNLNINFFCDLNYLELSIKEKISSYSFNIF